MISSRAVMMDSFCIESRVTSIPSKVLRWFLLGLRILGVVCLFAPGLARADYTYAVGTTIDDVSYQSCRSTPSANCSLRGAIFDATQHKEAGTITLQSGVTYTLQGAIVIQFPVTINVDGSSNAILDGNHQDRLFDIQPDSSPPNPTVVFDNLTIQNGEVPTGASSSSGGGIHGSVCTLILNGCLVQNNSTQAPGPGSSQPLGDGGGVEIDGADSQEAALSIENTTISGNLGQNGGGVSCSTCSLTITDSVLSGNTSAGPVGGGGLYLTGDSTATISGTSFSNNLAQTVRVHSSREGGTGGGIAAAASLVDLGSETYGEFSGDTAQGDGNEITNSSDQPSTITLPATWPTTSTLTANPATTDEYGQLVSLSASVAFNSVGGFIPVLGTLAITDTTSTTTLGSVSIAGSSASNTLSVSNSTLSVGAHDLQASYSGAFTSSVSGGLDYAITPNNQVSLSSSPSLSVYGQSVTFTARVSAVSPTSGTPTGTVTFLDGTTMLGTGALSSGIALFKISSLSAGSHSITAAYGGNSNFSTSTSSALSQTVNKASTTTALSSSANPSVFGQSVTFTTTVSAATPGSGTPTGTVTFYDNGTELGTGSLNSSGIATYSTSFSSLGSHSITAAYGGDSNFSANTSSALSQTVNQASTTTSLGSSANPSAYGQSVTFTATIGAVSPGSGTPTGTVTFYDNGTELGTGSLSGGIATYSTSFSSLGSHSITAAYGGDSNFSANTSSALSQTVNQASAIISLISSANPSVFGQSVTFTATVSVVAPGSGTPTGTVTFNDLPTLLGIGTLDNSGIATISTLSSSPRLHIITASYSGDTNFSASSFFVYRQTVNPASTITALSSSLNPSTYGQSVTFTATVSVVAPGSGALTGTVTFVDGSTTLGTGTLNDSGIATFSTSSLSGGSHSITAAYGGTSNFSASSSTLSQTVNKASTTTALSSSANPSVLGQSVTITAMVRAVSPGLGTPTGSITFYDNGEQVETGSLDSSGSATHTVSFSVLGIHSFMVSYNGDTNFSTNTSSAFSQTVYKASTTALSSSANPSVFGQSVTFTATVSAKVPGSGTPTGTVTFYGNGAALGSRSLNGGAATFGTSSLSLGSHSFTASYGGDSNFIASTSSALSQTVNQASTTTTLSSSTNPSVFGQPVTFTAKVRAVSPGSGTSTGMITFYDNGTELGTGSLSGGNALFKISSLSAGSHSITASYGGDSSFIASTSSALSQTVNKASTTTALISSANPLVLGQSVTFTTTVSVVSPGSGTPTGSVTFLDGSTMLGNGTLNGSGVARYSTSSISTGSHSITASYAGDTNFTTSTSTALTQAVKDETAPLTTATTNPALNAAGWTNAADVAVTLSATDLGGSGFRQMTYRETGATTLASQTSTQNPITVHVTNEGVTHLFFYSTDAAGNAEIEKSIDISIDRTPPSGTLGIDTATGTLQLTLQDALSGLTPILLSLLTNCTVTALDATTNLPLTIDWTDASDGTVSWNTGTTESMITGATDPIAATTDTIQLTAVKTDLSQKASLTLKALDQEGNLTHYDPVISPLSLFQKTSASQTFSHLQPDQGHLSLLNGAKGIDSLDIDYNGQAFHLANLQPNEARRIDVSSAYRKALNNTMTVTAQGAAGSAATVVLTDLNVVPLNGPSTGTPAGPGLTVGDVNGDGRVNVQDAIRLLRDLVGLEPLTGAALQAADVNGDGKIAIEDVVALLRRIVGAG